MSVSKDRVKALDAALAQINKAHGEGSAARMGDGVIDMKVETFSSGSLALDIALGSGLPKGRIIEIYGPEASGKTLTCLHAIAEVQKAGGIAAFIDAEHALDPIWAAKIGVNLDELVISQPRSGEQALEITDTLTRSGAVDLIIVDSVSALTPQKEIDGDMGDSMVGVQARLMSQGLRKLTGPAKASNTTIIFINQLREKIGVMFGSPETTTGGKALKFYASVRMDIRRIEQLKDGNNVVGNRVRVKVVKNKVATPYRQAEFDILFGEGVEGFNIEGDILTFGEELGLIKKSGSWFTLVNGFGLLEDGSQLGQGKEKARAALHENKELSAKLLEAIREAKFPKHDSSIEVDAGDVSLDSIEEEKD